MSVQHNADTRRRTASRLIVVLFVATLATMSALLVPITSSNTSRAAETPQTVITSPFHAWTWDPTNQRDPGSLNPDPRTVTIDQTDNLVSQVVRIGWENFSRSTSTNAISPGFYPVHVYECDNADPSEPSDCFGDQGFVTTHPGAGNVGDQTNAIQTFTGADGTGGVDFDVLTGADNPALGCAPDHPCSIVVVPWSGGRPATSHDGKDCTDHSHDLAYKNREGPWADSSGQTLNRGCDWDARIVIPLSFAPTPSNCPLRDSDLSAEGSPMMRRAIDQWRSGICHGADGKSPLQVQYTGLSEFQARNDFDRDAVDLGLTSQPASPDATRKFSYAPIGVTGLAIAYYVDNRRTGEPITDLRLSPRLIAKMLTQSYTDGLDTDCSVSSAYACADEVAGNPASLFDDPEFQALNPQYDLPNGSFDRGAFPFVSQGASSPNVVYGLSDNTRQITDWLHHDEAAAKFLAGDPDPNGMKVNTAYLPSETPEYPIDSFNANDVGHTRTDPECGELNGVKFTCAIGGLQNNWFPINGLDNVAATTVRGKNTAKLYRPVCDGNAPPLQGVCTNYVGAPAQPLGSRGIFAIVAAGDAAAYQFPTAQLETSTGSGDFVAMNDASMTAALGAMKTTAGLSALDYSNTLGADVYPLTTISYAMAPTCGLSTDVKSAVAAFLDYTASDEGNTSGVSPGQLAPGFLPLTDAMRSQTQAVASSVATETACPKTSTTTPGGSTTSSGAPATQPGGATGPGGGPIGPGGPINPGGPIAGNSAASGSSAAPSPSGSSSAAPSLPSTTPAAFRLPGDKAGAPAYVLPVILIIGAGLLLAGPAIVYVNRRGGLHRKDVFR